MNAPVMFTHLPSRLCLAFILIATGLHAEALWPEFRGPTAQGQSTATGLPTEWSRTQNIVWRTETEGRAWSSPIVANGKIFLTDATEKGSKLLLHVLALDAATGKALWNTQVLEQKNVERAQDAQEEQSCQPLRHLAGRPHLRALRASRHGLCWMKPASCSGPPRRTATPPCMARVAAR